MFSKLSKIYKSKGFVGSHYTGLVGKLRFIWESLVYHTEIVMVATPESLRELPVDARTSIMIRLYENYDDLQPYAYSFDSEYYPGFTKKWRAPFSWGETLAIGFVDNLPAVYSWIQWGHADGQMTYYGPILSEQARLIRAGVLPSFRRKKIYTIFNHILLELLFQRGIKQVYMDCSVANIAACKAQNNAGFLPVGKISVYFASAKHPFIRWHSGIEKK